MRRSRFLSVQRSTQVYCGLGLLLGAVAQVVLRFITPPLKRLYHKEDNHLLIFGVFSRGRSSNISREYELGNVLEYFKRLRKGPFGSISPIDVYMADGFFCILKNILKTSLVDIFMRCLSYRLIKIHRKFTSVYLLCDKASLTWTIDTNTKFVLLVLESCGFHYIYE